jgi:hypothetical protein
MLDIAAFHTAGTAVNPLNNAWNVLLRPSIRHQDRVDPV